MRGNEMMPRADETSKTVYGCGHLPNERARFSIFKLASYTDTDEYDVDSNAIADFVEKYEDENWDLGAESSISTEDEPREQSPFNSLERQISSLLRRACVIIDVRIDEELDLLSETSIWDSIEENEDEAVEIEIVESTVELFNELRHAIIVSVKIFPRHQELRLRDSLLRLADEEEIRVKNEIKGRFEIFREVAEETQYSDGAEQEIGDYGSDSERSNEKQLTEERLSQIEEEFEKDRHRLLRKRVKQLWVHLTISRDQTAASDFKKEQLLVLQSTRSSNLSGLKNRIYFETFDSNSFQRKVDGQIKDQPTNDFPERLQYQPQGSPAPVVSTNSQHRNTTEEGFSTRVQQYITDKMPLSGENFGGPALSLQSQGFAEPSFSSSPRVGNSSDDRQALWDRVQLLERENASLKNPGTPTSPQTFYFIQNKSERTFAAYLDEPTWSIDPKGDPHLKCRSIIQNPDTFLNNKKDTPFVISKFYDTDAQQKEARQACRNGQTIPEPKPYAEDLILKSDAMIEAFKEFMEKEPRFKTEFRNFNIRAKISAPYLFWYRYRSPEALNGLLPKNRDIMNILSSWIDENYGSLYDRAQEQIEKGVISPDTVQFLICPGDVMVWKEKRELTAVVAKSWPRPHSSPSEERINDMFKWEKGPDADDKMLTWSWDIETKEIRYDGLFYYRSSFIEVFLKAHSLKEEVPIQKLSAYPLKYANEEWGIELEKRGKAFWSCRKRRLVAYEDDRGFYGSSDRFMVDFSTYEELHSETVSFKRSYPNIDDPGCDRMDNQLMESDDPPTNSDIYIFPKSIVAYNLRSKKWIDLEVDKIRDVCWNKKSFEHLVLDHDTKKLVQALVTNQISREASTDIIDRKGNGLIILLHGGPGTGKTFTAESVAELAEKPLFRVTCGDIGTKPDDVEKYLESVLHLGKSWGCVVLLDEADVFLEQRRLTDLERNALVSVFLRVLEYYEGILILTSNRVGTFDEAFKSRIQLSLHYKNLTVSQRHKIWKNFFNRLRAIDNTAANSDMGDHNGTSRASEPLSIDFEEIDCFLPELAKIEMNGRQIRNSITTARQLAKFEGQIMSVHHLQHVIKVANKFDEYLKAVQGYSDDQIARGDGVR